MGLWFLIDNAFLVIKENVPKLIFGPGDGSFINPIGGLIGIAVLLFLNIYQEPELEINLSARGRTFKDSSKEDLP